MRIVIAALLFLHACSAPDQESDNDTSLILTGDSAIFFFTKIDSGIATSEELRRARNYFIKEDSLVVSDAKRLMQAGLVLMSGEDNYLYGVNYLIKLTKKYPLHPFAPEALMQLALFFENRFGDLERSETYLLEIIDRYPEHELAPQAQALLQLSDDEELNTIQNWLNKE